MTGPQEPFRPDVWGDRVEPVPGPAPQAGPDIGTGRPLDLSQDPDRFDSAAPPVVVPAPVPRRLDPARDPDRFGGPGDRTLTEMLGEGAQEERRDTYAWLGGLVGILAFLGLVAFLARYLGP